MKLRKIMAGVVATALAASTLAVAASAACLTKVEGTESTLSTGTGMWLLLSTTRAMKHEGKPRKQSSTSTTQRSLLLHLLSR